MSERTERVSNALHEAGYRRSWCNHSPKKDGFDLSVWVGPKVLIVQSWPDDFGIEVYAPLVATNSMDDLIEAIQATKPAAIAA